jgi:NADPH-dependent 7-cyano-7-deazaguanine reductase QueF
MLLALFVSIILFSNVANAKVIINNIEFTPTINESEYINISFAAISNTSNVTYEIYYEGVLVSGTNHYEEKTDYSYSGPYEYVLVAYDNESSALDNVTIEVLDIPLIIDIANPINTEYFTDNISIFASTNQNVETTCNYEVSNKSGNLQQANDPSSSTNGQLFSGYVMLGDGEYSLSVSCDNEFDAATSEVSFRVFTAPVQILSKAYTIDQGNGLHLNVETDYESECRYSLNDDDFSSMNIFSMTDNTIHSTIVDGLSEGGHKVYISCKSQNTAPSYDSILVSISTRPTATISIDTLGTLKQGIYTVTVKTSKDVQNNPSLTYSFNDDASPRTVSLAGSGTTWGGYLIIAEDAGNKIGSFKFSATDLNGIVGNIITDGEIFLVDTLPPSEISDFQAVLDGYNIKLSWFYEGDDFENFKIYRSDGELISKNDLLKTTGEQEFEDKNVAPGKMYTYRINAVDKAGNEGPPSEDIQIEIPDIETQNFIDEQPILEKNLDKSLYSLVDDKISETEIMLLDIDSMQKKLDAVTDTTELKVISLLELDSKIKNAKSTTENVLSQLKDLKNQDLTRAELEVQLNKLKLDAIKAQSNVVEELTISEKGSFEQMTQESDVESAITYIIDGTNVSKSQLKEYIDSNKRLQDQVIVKTESVSYKIRNLNQENYDKQTLIHKTIISSSKIDNVQVIEIIPKEVENTASEISYLKISSPEIIKDDPVVKWDYDSFESTELYYIIGDNIPLTSLKNIRTILLTKPDFKISEGAITGMTSFEKVSISNLSPIHWIIVIGLGIILMLGGYYFVVLEKQDENRVKKHKIISNDRIGNTRNALRDNLLLRQARQQKTSIQKIPIQNAKKQYESKLFQRGVVLQNSVIQNNAKYPDYVSNKNDLNNIDDKLPESIIRKIDYCNSVINMMDYERARSVYNDTVNLIPDFDDEDALKKLSHVKTKLEAYMHIHNARRHLYFKRLDHFSVTIKSLNECYGTIAHNIGFMQHADTGSEVKFLNFVAENVKQLEKNRDMMLRK